MVSGLAAWLDAIVSFISGLFGASPMANAVQRIGALRDRVRVERRGRLTETEDDVLWDEGDDIEFAPGDDIDWTEAQAGDGAGNFETTWRPLLPARAARIAPRRGGEDVVAARLTGVDAYDIWVRRDEQTKAITVGDRVIDARDESRIFGVRFIANLDERGRYLLLQCTIGDAEG